MHQYVVDHAINNVWSSPRQDNQLVVAPKRITPPRGALNVVRVMGSYIDLPAKKRYTHVFQVGQLDPTTLGLMRQIPHWRMQKWFKFSEAVNHSKLEVTIYTADGVVMPRTDCYYMFTDERAVIFAVPEQKRRSGGFKNNLQNEVYFRFYHNNYFRSNVRGVKEMECDFATPQNTKEILDLEAKLELIYVRPGHTFVWVDGLLVDKARLGDVKMDSYVEWVYDSSVKRTVEWKLEDLLQFRSHIDDTYKYLLHYEGSSDKTIDYQDDIDVYIGYQPENAYSKSVYYNRNQEHHHRMVTHRDYSIDTNVAWTLANDLTEMLSQESFGRSNLIVKAFIREGGRRRPLVFDNQRIFELYKLEESKIRDAMNGVHALVPEWQAANLEASGYTELMRANYNDVNMELVERAYGYNALSVILGDTPQKLSVDSGYPVAYLPYGLAQRSTVYEFDEYGRFLGWRTHLNDNSYEPTSPACRLIEAVSGTGSSTLDCIFGQTNIPIPEGSLSYRVYMCYLIQGQPNENWVDITGAEGYYKIENGKLVWLMGGAEHWIMIRTDKNLLALDFELSHNDGLFNFSLMENPSGNPMDDLVPMTIPLAQLDIWLNGYKLIRGLDYHVKFPQVFVTNKTFLIQPIDTAVQKVHVRMMGLPRGDLEMDTIEETGWVLNGQLSDNRIYDVREDRVMQINIGGKIYHREELLFAEKRPGGSLLNPLNGLPYQIKDLIVPMRTNTTSNTYDLRSKSQEIDRRVSAYMTEHYGDMGSTDLSAITARYPVVSPFLSHILFLLRNRLIQLPEERLLSDQEVRTICQTHEGLLDFDPLNDLHTPDLNFAYIVPHADENPFELDFQSYRFFTQVVKIYGMDKLKVTDYVTMRT